MSGELTNSPLGRFHVRKLLGRDLAIKVRPAAVTRHPVHRAVFAIRGFR